MGNILGKDFPEMTKAIHGEEYDEEKINAELHAAMKRKEGKSMLALWDSLIPEERAKLAELFSDFGEVDLLAKLFELVSWETSTRLKTWRERAIDSARKLDQAAAKLEGAVKFGKEQEDRVAQVEKERDAAISVAQGWERVAKEQEDRADLAEGDLAEARKRISAWYEFMLNREEGRKVMNVLSAIADGMGTGRQAVVNAAVKDLEERLDKVLAELSDLEEHVKEREAELDTALEAVKFHKEQTTTVDQTWRSSYIELEQELSKVRGELKDARSEADFRSRVAADALSLLTRSIQAQGPEDWRGIVLKVQNLAEELEGRPLSTDGKTLVCVKDHPQGNGHYYLVTPPRTKSGTPDAEDAFLKALDAFEEETGAKPSPTWSHVVKRVKSI